MRLDVDLLPTDRRFFETSWLLEDDFDINAIDVSITNTIADWCRPAELNADPYVPPRPAPDLNQEAAGSNIVSSDVHHMVSVQQSWYTNVTADSASSRLTRRTSEQEAVDENYRASLAHQLQARINDDVLPSAEFLVSLDAYHLSCIQLTSALEEFVHKVILREIPSHLPCSPCPDV